jgi:hypothetical protein
MRCGLWVLVGSVLSSTAWAEPPMPSPAAPPPVAPVEVRAIPPQGRKAPTPTDFQRALTPYGRWVQTAYGLAWTPNVSTDWRPYSNGRWDYTDRGWTFVANERWGWAPFHYGRWVYDQGRWIWLPGYEWAPAWVTWRCSDDFIAWAPLGPFGLGLEYYDAPLLWLAVRAPVFGGPLQRGAFIATAQMGPVFRATRFVGVPRPGAYYSPRVTYVERVVGHRVARVPVAGRRAIVVRPAPARHPEARRERHRR